MIIYLTPQGKSFNPNSAMKINGVQIGAGDLLREDVRMLHGVTTKEVVEPEHDPLTQSRAQQDDTGEWSAPADLPFEQAMQNKLNAFQQQYEQAMQLVRAGYPESEVASWDKQEAEAKAWQADNSAITPFIDALSVARGVDKAEMVTRIINKADVATIHTATQTGIRQALEDAVNAEAGKDSPSVAALRNINWPN